MEGREMMAFTVIAVLLAAGHLGFVNCQLSSTFYATTCPNVEAIVKTAVGNAVNSSQIVGPSVLRLFAHDCFVDGCDGSILLQDTPSSPPVERDASDNLSLQQKAFDTIDQAKQAVEASCPGIVSCADILTMAARDVVSMMGGPTWSVLHGRRDGLTSSVSSVAGKLPGSDMNVAQLTGIFKGIGLSTQDVVTLSGSHTVGFAHCPEFANRVYNFNNVSGATDPSLAVGYIPTLKSVCPLGNFSGPNDFQSLDPPTANQFDNSYYQQLQIGQGLLFSDQILFVDNTTTNLVTTYANNQAQFFTDFMASMIAMSKAGVLTGTQGEIRLNCSVVNSGVPSPPPTNSTPPTNATPPSTPTPAAPLPAPPSPIVSPSPPPVTPTPTPLVPPVTPSRPPVIPSPPPVTPSPPPVIPSPVTPSAPPAPIVAPPTPKVASPPPPPGGRRLRR